ncbi:hypothetical protein BV20DRAFT_934940 [Pilatotrama ljubarskyi]|nr:hypothetical protein BV20DRAFT_934940 [Pilatotrama ljubarskyi]
MKRADFPDLPESVPLPDPVVDSDAEEERMVEVHLSAPNGYVLPDWTSAGTVGIKEEPTSVSIKREPSPETITYWSAPSWEAEVKPRLEEEREDPESVIEVHVSSKNQHLVFGHPSRVHAKQDSVKEEETPGPQDVLERHGTPPFKREVEDETIVEVHISSKDIQRAFDTSVDRDSVKAEEVSDA